MLIIWWAYRDDEPEAQIVIPYHSVDTYRNTPSYYENVNSYTYMPDTSEYSEKRQEIKCSVCDGSGKRDCPACDGQGGIQKTHYPIDFGQGATSYKTTTRCDLCDGTGKADCRYCQGNGWISD